MKILFVTHSFPFPICEGIRLRVYYLLKHLSKRHETHLLSYCFSREEEKFLNEISPFCASVTTITHPVPQQPWKRVLSMIFDEGPFCLRQFYSPEMETALKSSAAKIRPDVVHFDHTPMAQFEKDVPDLPKVFSAHDAMSMLFHRNSQYERHPARKLYFYNQQVKFRRFEARILGRFEKTVVVSPVDCEVLQSRSPKASVVWNPNGVDHEYFDERPADEKEDVILFRGIMDFFPNHDAAHFFASAVMPLIWKESPTASFWIAGQNPARSLRRMVRRDSRIKTLGFVADIREPMGQATVIVCPMRTGSGIKNKTLESLSMAKGVVCTPMSLAGIAAAPEQHLLVGETPEQLAAQTLRLLKDRDLRRRLGAAGRRLVIEQHSWADHAAFFESVYRDAVTLRATRGR